MSGPSDSSAAQQRAAPSASTPQLSCELCRERKVKCDKLEPCTTCVTANVDCVSIFRPRLPRGRHAQKKNSTADAPQQRLKQPRRESQQSQQQQQMLQSPTKSRAGTQSKDGNGTSDAVLANPVRRTSDAQAEGSGSNPESTGPYSGAGSINGKSTAIAPMDFQQPLSPLLQTNLGTSAAVLGSNNMSAMTSDELFWINTFEKFDEPSKTSYTSDDFGTAGLQGTELPSFDFTTGPFKMLCGSRRDNAAPVPPTINSATARRLCQVYLDQVDPVIKVLHRPSLSRFMQCGEPYLDFPEGHASVVALSAAVCYVAACSLSETQCQTGFQDTKASLVLQTQDACESALERAEVIAASDITVLQAFILYLVGRRSKEQSRAVWSLVSLAVRLAKGMSIHVNPGSLGRGRGESFFDRQMRKRLWLTICVMDLQASFAYGSEPLIHVEEVSGALDGLRHVNDSDFEPATTEELMNKETLTDVTFPFVAFLAQVSGRLLNYTSRREDVAPISSRRSASSLNGRIGDSPPPSSLMDQDARERISAAFEQKAFNFVRFCDPEDSARAWFTWHSTQALVASTRLAALRPLQQARPGADEAWMASPRQEQRRDAELQMGLRILDKFQLMHTDPRSEALRWYVTVPWQALSIVVAGCYVSNDAVFIRRAWPVVEFVWQTQQSLAGSRDHKAVAAQLENKIRQTRDILRPVLQSGTKNPAAEPRVDSAFGSTFTALSTPLRTPSMSSSTSLNYFPSSVGTTVVDSFRMPASTTATAPSINQSSKKAWNSMSVQDTFSMDTDFDMGQSLPINQVNDPPLQTWEDAMLCDVDDLINSGEVDMAGNYLDGFMMPL